MEEKIYQKPILATVALPMYRAKNIGWLALESLCHQKTDIAWELIMVEESSKDHEPIAQEEVRKRVDRLKKAGCVRVQHFFTQEKMPLSLKWRTIARNAAKDSKVFLLQAADCYSDPDRIQRSYEAITEGADWVHRMTGLFVDLRNGNKAVYRHPQDRHATALDMAVRTDLVRELPSDIVEKGVDGWIFRSCTAIAGHDLTVYPVLDDSWRRAVDTHGYNTISHKRGDLISATAKHFHPTEVSLSELPPHVARRLQKMIDANMKANESAHQ